MKNLKKIIALFFIIFFTGIYITVKSIDTSLNKNLPTETIIVTQQDSIHLIKQDKKTV